MKWFDKINSINDAEKILSGYCLCRHAPERHRQTTEGPVCEADGCSIECILPPPQGLVEEARRFSDVWKYSVALAERFWRDYQTEPQHFPKGETSLPDMVDRLASVQLFTSVLDPTDEEKQRAGETARARMLRLIEEKRIGG